MGNDLVPDGWKIWYTDDRVYNSKSTRWENLPDTGVLGVVIYYDGGDYRDILSGGDWYYIDGDTPSKTDTHEEWGEWVDPPEGIENYNIKRGEAVSDSKMESVNNEMWRAKQW